MTYKEAENINLPVDLWSRDGRVFHAVDREIQTYKERTPDGKGFTGKTKKCILFTGQFEDGGLGREMHKGLKIPGVNNPAVMPNIDC